VLGHPAPLFPGDWWDEVVRRITRNVNKEIRMKFPETAGRSRERQKLNLLL